MLVYFVLINSLESLLQVLCNKLKDLRLIRV